MGFYQSIAAYYDHIFPPDYIQAEFITSTTTLPIHGSRVLDIGCGTGSLAISLSHNGFEVVGIDLDTAMVEKATIKAHGQPHISFYQMDMRDVSRKFAPSSFDAIACFGNTLVHLQLREDVASVFKGAEVLLKENGKFLLQILNYDHIMARRLPGLPSIENEIIRFDRIYRYNDDMSITFATKLTIKANSQIIENEVFLYPLRKIEIEAMLTEAGFQQIQFYGDFHKNPLMAESLPLLVEAQK